MDRCRGTILGVAVGDALGLPYEGCRREKLKNSPVVDMKDGLWSDDTSLTLCLAQSLAEKGTLDLEDLGKKFCMWFQEGYLTPFGKVVGIGRTTRQAIVRILRGKDPKDAGSKGEKSNGNGSLMRISPIPLFFRDKGPEVILKMAHQASLVTHAHPRSLIACGIYSLVIYFILKGNKKEKAYRLSAEFSYNYYSRRSPFSEELYHYKRILSGRIAELSEREIRSSGYVVDTLEASLWCFLKEGSFEDTVLSAVNLGGDTDTIGAVTGALAGSYYGDGEIPKRWVDSLASKRLILQVIDRFCTSRAPKNGPC